MTAPFLIRSPSAPLRLEIGKVISSFRWGVHRSAFKGSGFEFWGLRPYEPSDRMADIDWLASLKVDTELRTLISKVRRTDKEISVVVTVDLRGAMRIPTKKIICASEFLWLFALSAFRYRDRFRLLLFQNSGIRDSGWLRSEDALGEWITHTDTLPVFSSDEVLPSDTFTKYLSDLNLDDAFLLVVSDFTSEWEAAVSGFGNLGLDEHNLRAVFIGLDEWSGFDPTNFSFDIRDPQTGRIERMGDNDVLIKQKATALSLGHISLILAPFSITFISVPLFGETLKTLQRELFRNSFE